LNPLNIDDNRAILIEIFPELKNDPHFIITSPWAPDYNCIAWANNRDNVWWDNSDEEGTTWPIENKSPHYSSLVELFKSKGFVECEDYSFDPNFVKVALYVNEEDHWTHASRQDRNGKWKSKLGKIWDIIHGTPHTIENVSYGKAKIFMCIKFF
jgi:hypothetical protein